MLHLRDRCPFKPGTFGTNNVRHRLPTGHTNLVDANDPTCAFTAFARVHAITNMQVRSVHRVHPITRLVNLLRTDCGRSVRLLFGNGMVCRNQLVADDARSRSTDAPGKAAASNAPLGCARSPGRLAACT